MESENQQHWIRALSGILSSIRNFVKSPVSLASSALFFYQLVLHTVVKLNPESNFNWKENLVLCSSSSQDVLKLMM